MPSNNSWNNSEWGTPPEQQAAPKSRRPLYWVLGLLALGLVAALVVFFVGSKSQDEQNSAASDPAGTATVTVTQQPSTTKVTRTEIETEVDQASVDPCSQDVMKAQNWNFERFAVNDCQNGWLIGGTPQTDAIGLYQWNGEKWQRYEADGETFTGFECYDFKSLRAQGAPEVMLQQVTECTTRSFPVHLTPEQPSCDGRNVLIVESVIVHPGEDADKEIAQALGRHSGAKFTNPGQCSSLRAEAEGGKVYPVYYDFGRDASAMCQRKAAIGGNGRTLNNSADFSDPCE
ncbi:hypothetical protein [Corynebacterium pelargi]|uniref:hypothetical protein n=1 Tax=Corynebacterium pelargi TaxID=1471400 RepID=UPI001008ACE1|nr:hypothetical protein [Corynebacterium pelargi]